MTSTASKLDYDTAKAVSYPKVAAKSQTHQKTQTPLSVIPKNRVQLRKRKESGHPLRDLRVKAGLTLEELSEATNMSPSYLSRLESGSRRLNEDILSRLSQALDCSPAELLVQIQSKKTEKRYETSSTDNVVKIKDLPVYIVKNNDDGKPSVSSQSVELINRPSEYVGVKNAFCCRLEESAWTPRYQKGETLLLNPYSPLKDGCSILVKSKDNRIYIGSYKAIENEGLPTELTLVLNFSETQDEITFSLKDIEAFRITGTLS